MTIEVPCPTVVHKGAPECSGDHSSRGMTGFDHILYDSTLTLSHLATTFNIYYLMRPGPKNESIKAFPPGLRVSSCSLFPLRYRCLT